MAWSWISWFRTPKLSRSTSDHVTNMWDPWQTKTYGMFGRKFTSTACPQSLRSLLAQQVLVWLCPTKGPKCKFLFEQGIDSRRSPTPFLTNATRKTGSCQVANRSDCSVNFGRAMKSGLDVDRALLILPAERHTSTCCGGLNIQFTVECSASAQYVLYQKNLKVLLGRAWA